uniref:Glycosyltransferase n=1 Tax=viral metagenome TaxID=1070528 RepID=A0A6M3MCY7_9ZZZZ
MSVHNGKPYGILLFEKWHGKYNIGSSRIRGHWLAKYWPEAEIFRQGAKYDAVIFQKCYWPSYASEFGGVKILDLCDPDWLAGVEVKAMVDNCDAVTTSTEELKRQVEQFTDSPVVFIPDRHDLDFAGGKTKVHEGKAKRVCWFGYSHNLNVLDIAINTIRRNDLKLTVIHNLRPFYAKADKNVEWKEDTVNEDILKCDFVVLPEDMRPLGKYKSNNKAITAWALGMPVAKTPEDVERFLDPEERRKEAELRLKEVREKWDVRISVGEFRDLIERIKKQKKSDEGR